MRRGCIASTEEIECNECHQIIPDAARYLAVVEEDSVEAENGETSYYCLECAVQKGYAYHKEEKGEMILTFFE